MFHNTVPALAALSWKLEAALKILKSTTQLHEGPRAALSGIQSLSYKRGYSHPPSATVINCADLPQILPQILTHFPLSVFYTYQFIIPMICLHLRTKWKKKVCCGVLWGRRLSKNYQPLQGRQKNSLSGVSYKFNWS